MTNISVIVDDEILVWLDQLIQQGVIKNRSEAIRGGLYTFVQIKLGIKNAKELRILLDEKKKKPFQNGVDVIREIREERE
jgi:Arc/MetJ-type ribon-helix-helix transcriptional regulator